ncbi:hypothetical protein FA893_01480 [Photobacterium damselae subsp. piscicida]|uniref:Uncharacterized protein n=1 Tax=Photobacterium damsela subsp. piscicida TaxID=38294 RepID=A0A1Q9GVL9_PHODP|nr:hypothetical protein [Photobacterium damselae]MBE8126901.1 hypothetical protein [Photobacterium damselae subsp. piscicida]MBE8130088.1 hypothetical protein [Photobacterium damselae subsp. piscicida]MDP2514002.1 hypothetical protein [Photobacterium damselae subsp. piscicida]MDP2515453.1 hypothetical protein [Photobacterium damselae subsp. piscicida]MDP2515934.1 hypothetical protein [Photobacterium damselae subsp. piscicida]
MINISFKLDGKPVKPNDIADALKASMFVAIENQVRESIGLLSCPVHNESPQIIIHGDDINDIKLEFNGCCDELMNLVTESLDQQEAS